MSIDTIRRYIQDEILNDPAMEIEPDQDLLLSEALNSLGVMRLVAYIEGEFDIEVPPEDVTIDHFATLNLISAYVTARSG
jgi:acyl carrier protein